MVTFIDEWRRKFPSCMVVKRLNILAWMFSTPCKTVFNHTCINVFLYLHSPKSFCTKWVHIVASELKDPIWHSSVWQIGSFSYEATIFCQSYLRKVFWMQILCDVTLRHQAECGYLIFLTNKTTHICNFTLVQNRSNTIRLMKWEVIWYKVLSTYLVILGPSTEPCGTPRQRYKCWPVTVTAPGRSHTLTEFPCVNLGFTADSGTMKSFMCNHLNTRSWTRAAPMLGQRRGSLIANFCYYLINDVILTRKSTTKSLHLAFNPKYWIRGFYRLNSIL